MKTLLRTFCGALLLLGLWAAAAAQSHDQQFGYTRYYVVPGQEQALIQEFAKANTQYKTTGIPWHFYQFDDHTLEAVMPIKDLAELDRCMNAFKASLNLLPVEERVQLRDPAVRERSLIGQENGVLQMHHELSYFPENAPDFKGPVPYYEIVAYRAKPGQLANAFAHGRSLVELLQDIESPVGFEFCTFRIGGALNTFYIAFPATDAADLARRRAQQETLITPAIEAWRAKTRELVDEVRTVRGTYLPELSNDVEPPATTLAVVYEDRVKPGMLPTCVSAYEKLIAAQRDTDADVYWNASIMEDGRIYTWAPLDHYSDIDVLEEKIQDRNRQLDPARLGAAMQRFEKAVSGSQRWVVRQHTDLQYVHPDVDSPDDFAHFKQSEYTFALADRERVLTLCRDYAKLMRQHDVRSNILFFTAEFGGPDNLLYVREYGRSKEAVDELIAAAEEEIAGDAFDEWAKRYAALLTPKTKTYGRSAPEIAYLSQN